MSPSIEVTNPARHVPVSDQRALDGFGDHRHRNIIKCWSKASRGDHQLGSRQGFLERIDEDGTFIAHGGVTLAGNTEICQAARQVGRVGVDGGSTRELGADGQ